MGAAPRATHGWRKPPLVPCMLRRDTLLKPCPTCNTAEQGKSMTKMFVCPSLAYSHTLVTGDSTARKLRVLSDHQGSHISCSAPADSAIFARLPFSPGSSDTKYCLIKPLSPRNTRPQTHKSAPYLPRPTHHSDSRIQDYVGGHPDQILHPQIHHPGLADQELRPPN